MDKLKRTVSSSTGFSSQVLLFRRMRQENQKFKVQSRNLEGWLNSLKRKGSRRHQIQVPAGGARDSLSDLRLPQALSTHLSPSAWSSGPRDESLERRTEHYPFILHCTIVLGTLHTAPDFRTRPSFGSRALLCGWWGLDGWMRLKVT